MTTVHVRVADVSKSFGGSRALSDVSLEIFRGQVHCLIGENGAGKSTLGRLLAGIHRPDEGSIEVAGREVSFRSPAEALAAGIAGMAQEVALVPAMSVADNILLGANEATIGFVSRQRQRERVEEILARYDFVLDPDARVGDLRIADQQKVEILKAIARGSDLIVMDEPTASLGDKDARALLEVVRRLRDDGTTIIYISHHLDEVLSIADRVSVLRDGRVVYDGDPLTKSELVVHMLGRPLEASFPEKTLPAPDAPVVLRVEDLACGDAFSGVSFSVRAGEIVGLAGLVGSGRSALARVLGGVERPRAGTIEVRGAPQRFRSPRAAMRAGVHLIPEDRKRQGLILVRPTRENITSSVLERLSTLGVVDSRAEREIAERAATRTDVRAASLETPVWALSGGNQQKVMFARASLAEPAVLLIDEPTKGVDVGAKFAIHQLIGEIAARGVAVVLISSEHEEVMGLAHRLLVMAEGVLVAEFDGPEFPADEVSRAVMTDVAKRTDVV
ncbi:sugar ABC transporter ATP-binding protein [Microbacterium immunditiarum]|uniref:Simple sugar transport system ATP-binding protein/ribose transport system ATP-binding protein n=1 Tax=Microbacterium immunditiarum TaxID=337480 RepID=A0A7Y9GMT8_9MICO|nr:sugar ABC transporter ATP-binding protein [Microbacterium immunditiarum]NYE19398.1 simple sugar transport system ATP-binding protein/ribose transport system ATP-binding protein [Microbacterium immunditiarum]